MYTKNVLLFQLGQVAQLVARSASVPNVLGSTSVFSTSHKTCLFIIKPLGILILRLHVVVSLGVEEQYLIALKLQLPVPHFGPLGTGTKWCISGALGSC